MYNEFEKIMNKLKKFFLLPLVPTVLIAIPSFVAVFLVLTGEISHSAVAYAVYILSAYALVITITKTVEIVRWFRSAFYEHPAVKAFMSHPLVERYVNEKLFRAEISLYPGLLINLLYAGIKFYSGLRYRSVWFGTLSVYYILLAVMRFSLLHHVRGGRRSYVSELRRCRLCGIILLILDWALTGIIILVVRENSGFEYPGMLIYVMAMYAFYAVITAFVNIIKFRKYGSPVMSAAKVISLTAALVSMLSLETAMLTQFGAAQDALFRQRMSAVTGACVSIVVLGMAVYMIVQTTKKLKYINIQED